MTNRIRGIRQTIPPGTVLARVGNKPGPAVPVKFASLFQGSAKSGGGGGGGGGGGSLPPLTNGDIWVGDASDVATAVAPSGDVTMTNAGVFTIKTNVALAGSPTTTTQTPGTNNTTIATTAYADAAAGGGGATGANPTATAGPNAVNGSATTFLRSDGAPAVQLGSSSQKGIVQVDGTSITDNGSGVISATGNVAGTSWLLNLPSTGTNTASFASKGTIIVPQTTCTIYAVAALLTTVTSATYKIGIAPYDTGANKITSSATYTGVTTFGTGAANSWIFGNFSGGFSVTGGSTYIIFLVRTDSTGNVSTTTNTATGSQSVPNFSRAAATSPATAVLASTAPTTSDTWTPGSGAFYVIAFIYNF